MKVVTLFAAIAVSSVCFAQSAAKPIEKEKLFDPTRNASDDLAKAIKKATKENKRILIDVGGNWCGWCHKLDKLFTTDETVKKTLASKYVLVKVNFSPENENKEFLSKYPKISGYPHIFVLEKDGKLLHSQDTGLLETGPNHDTAKVIAFLNKWAITP